MTPARAIANARTVFFALAQANTHCDAVFNVARSKPRQGVLLAQLAATRLARNEARAISGSKHEKR